MQDVVDVDLAAVAAVLVAAVLVFGPFSQLVTKAVDTLRNAFDRRGRLPKVTWNISAFVVGVALALLFGINLAAQVAKTFPALVDTTVLDSTWGVVLTGLISGAMASYWHERNDALSAQGTTAEPEVVIEETRVA